MEKLKNKISSLTNSWEKILSFPFPLHPPPPNSRENDYPISFAIGQIKFQDKIDRGGLDFQTRKNLFVVAFIPSVDNLVEKEE